MPPRHDLILQAQTGNGRALGLLLAEAQVDALASDHAQALTKFAALLSALDHKANRSTAH